MMFAQISRSVNVNAKSTIRWLAIAALGCYGIFTLVDSGSHRVAHADAHWASFLFLLGYSGLFIAVAYLVFRRQYRLLCTLVSAPAALLVFSFLVSLPKQFGLYEWTDKWVDSPLAFIGLPLSLATLLIPFYSARWAFRHGQAFLARFIHDDTRPQRAA
jgi:hypothetical protein